MVSSDTSAFPTVVLVTYNSAAVLQAALSGVSERLPGAEVIVVDNGSHDDTCAIARAAEARVIAGQGNVGFGAGVNIGVRAASTPTVLVLNPDARLIATDVPKLHQLMRQGQLGLVAAFERTETATRPLLQPTRRWPSNLAWSMFRWFVLPRELRDTHLPVRRGERRISGAAFLLRRSEFLTLGGFDERIFLYFEDEELSHRYLQERLPVTASDALVVDHQGGDSASQNLEQVIAWCLLSMVQMVANLDGPRAARRCARWIVRSLSLLGATARFVRWVPLLGRRTSRKARQVCAVQRFISEACESPPRPTVYPDAIPLLRAALPNHDPRIER